MSPRNQKHYVHPLHAEALRRRSTPKLSKTSLGRRTAGGGGGGGGKEVNVLDAFLVKVQGRWLAWSAQCANDIAAGARKQSKSLHTVALMYSVQEKSVAYSCTEFRHNEGSYGLPRTISTNPASPKGDTMNPKMRGKQTNLAVRAWPR